jgi:hypothetical protein
MRPNTTLHGVSQDADAGRHSTNSTTAQPVQKTPASHASVYTYNPLDAPLTVICHPVSVTTETGHSFGP